LKHLRGMDWRHLRSDVAAEILAAVKQGLALPAGELRVPPADEVPKELRPAVAMLMAWVAQLARDEHVDASLLATRGDLAAYLRGDADARLAGGWRSAMVAGPVGAIVEGRAALAFNGGGGLVLEDRSGRPYQPGAGAGG
jgi:ribonuclease D